MSKLLFFSNVPEQMPAGLFRNDSLLMTNLQLNWNPGPTSVTECHNSVVCSWTADSGTRKDEKHKIIHIFFVTWNSDGI